MTRRRDGQVEPELTIPDRDMPAPPDPPRRRPEVTKPQVIAATVRFRRWKKRVPWTCDTCAALTNDPQRHAAWHASLAGNPLPPNITKLFEGGEYLTVHVGEMGWVL